MTAFVAWGQATLLASTALMLVVLVVRAPTRRWVGPRLGYALWALPALRMLLPEVPIALLERLTTGAVATGMSVLFVGPDTDLVPWSGQASSLGAYLPSIWLAGAVALFATFAIRHLSFCRRLRAAATDLGWIGTIRILAADVDGPLAFGVFRRCIAVPRAFEREYPPHERRFVLAHERLHHARGDLIANWVSLAVLAAHWWNPVAWAAIRAFRDDQEYAVDAHVLAGKPPAERARYARLLAKAAGFGALPACNFFPRSNLKGRLTMILQTPFSCRRLALRGAALALLGSTALAATVATSGAATGTQATTIGVKPDGAGGHALLIGATAVAPGTPLPDGLVLPADFSAAGGCNLKRSAKPVAMVIKGIGAAQTYTVMCASAAAAPVRVSISEGLASLKTMRASVAAQSSPSFPEAERVHALAAIDRSIGEVEATLAAIG